MPKKQLKSNNSKKNSKKQNKETEKILVENFIALQKVMVNLSGKIDNLTNQLSKLLDLFEISAKALVEKDFDFDKESKENKKIGEKIDNLIDQNKTIARGLTLLHEGISSPNQEDVETEQVSLKEGQNISQYQKSISSRNLPPLPTSLRNFKGLPKNDSSQK